VKARRPIALIVIGLVFASAVLVLGPVIFMPQVDGTAAEAGGTRASTPALLARSSILQPLSTSLSSRSAADKSSPLANHFWVSLSFHSDTSRQEPFRAFLRAKITGLLHEALIDKLQWNGWLPLDEYLIVGLEAQQSQLAFAAPSNISIDHPHAVISFWEHKAWVFDVRDSVTNAPLKDISVWTCLSTETNPVALQLQGPTGLPEEGVVALVENMASPVSIPSRLPSVLWIGSPGYLWTSLERLTEWWKRSLDLCRW
jgi:hypothetical protein